MQRDYLNQFDQMEKIKAKNDSPDKNSENGSIDEEKDLAIKNIKKSTNETSYY